MHSILFLQQLEKTEGKVGPESIGALFIHLKRNNYNCHKTVQIN